MEAEVQMLVASFYGPLAEEGTELRADVEASFSGAIGQVQSAINDLTARKIDPVKVPAEGGNINLRKTLSNLVEERERIMREIEETAGGEAEEPGPQAAAAE